MLVAPKSSTLPRTIPALFFSGSLVSTFLALFFSKTLSAWWGVAVNPTSIREWWFDKATILYMIHPREYTLLFFTVPFLALGVASFKLKFPKRFFVISFILLCICLSMFISFVPYEVSAQVSTNQSFTPNAYTGTAPYSYLIFTDGTYYFAKEGNGGSIAYGGPGNAGGATGTSLPSVINQTVIAINNVVKVAPHPQGGQIIFGGGPSVFNFTTTLYIGASQGLIFDVGSNVLNYASSTGTAIDIDSQEDAHFNLGIPVSASSGVAVLINPVTATPIDGVKTFTDSTLQASSVASSGTARKSGSVGLELSAGASVTISDANFYINAITGFDKCLYIPNAGSGGQDIALNFYVTHVHLCNVNIQNGDSGAGGTVDEYFQSNVECESVANAVGVQEYGQHDTFSLTHVNNCAASSDVIFGGSAANDVVYATSLNEGFTDSSTAHTNIVHTNAIPASGSVTAGASVWTYTNVDARLEEMILSTVGGISAETCTGVTSYPITAGSDCILNPGATMDVTWSTTAPVYTKVFMP